MKSIIRFAGVLICALLFIIQINAQGQPVTQDERQQASLLSRIGAVENSLTPYVPVAGREGWNIHDRMKQYGVMGLSIAVVHNYQLEWAKGYGWADAARRQPVTTETMFSAGSISKPVAALAAMKLVQDGALNLDRPINDYLKSWKIPANEFTQKTPVTLRQLLSHTAGTTQHGFWGYTPEQKLPNLVEVLSGTPPAQSRAIVVNAEPGKEFRYSGGGVEIAQLAVMDVTGQSYDEFLDKTVFQPLGMRHSTYQQPLPARFQNQASWGFSNQPWFKGMPYVYPESAAAGLYTTPSDLARFIIELQNAYRGTGGKVVDRRTAQTMLAPVKTDIEPGYFRSDIALGPFLLQRTDNRDDSAGVYFNHSGVNAGFVADFFGSLEGGNGVVVMTNQGEAGGLLKEIIRSVAVVYQWPHFLPDQIAPLSLSESELRKYAGRYKKGDDEVLTFTVEKNHLLEKGVDWQIGVEVYPVAKDAFAFTDYTMKGVFITNDRSEVKSFKFVGSDQAMERMKDDEFVPAELLKMGRTGEAIDGYRKMKSMNENRLTYMAYTLINGKPANPRQGLALARLACELYPTSSAAYLRLAEAHEKLDDLAQAVRFYQKVLELETDNKDAREKLSKLKATRDR